MNRACVLNRHNHMQHRPPGTVLIDRSGPWGNTYKIGRDGSREAVLVDHEHWLRRELPLMMEIWRLRDRPLMCWCDPMPCHGWLLAYLANCDGDKQLAWQLGETFWTPFMLRYRSLPGMPGWRVKMDDL